MVPAGGIELDFEIQGESSLSGRDLPNAGQTNPQPSHLVKLTNANIVDVTPESDTTVSDSPTLQSRKITEQQQKINRTNPGVTDADKGKTTSELLEIILAWATLPEVMRAGIMAMIRATTVPHA